MNDKGDFKWKHFSPKTHTTDDIIKLIKRYYTTGRLNESSKNKVYDDYAKEMDIFDETDNDTLNEAKEDKEKFAQWEKILNKFWFKKFWKKKKRLKFTWMKKTVKKSHDLKRNRLIKTNRERMDV